jgi:hypothetical protein
MRGSKRRVDVKYTDGVKRMYYRYANDGKKN